MKLNELFDTEIKSLKSNNKFSTKVKTADESKEDKNFHSRTSGSNGRIHLDNDDPHVVKKINHNVTHLDTDGYYVYIRSVVDNKIAQENPFAPRVYAIKTVTDGNGEARFKITVEKLVESDALSEDQIKAVMDNLFNADDVENELKHNSRRSGNIRPLVIANIIEKIMEGRTKSKSSRLNDLLQHINDLAHTEPNLTLDIHRGNFMFRLGAYIPQLVIIDPLV